MNRCCARARRWLTIPAARRWCWRTSRRRGCGSIGETDDDIRRKRAYGGAHVARLETSGEDDTLTVLFMCCHPALTPASAIALTLRAVGGLTTAEIASAFLVGEATMAQRISRAKAKLRGDGTATQPQCTR